MPKIIIDTSKCQSVSDIEKRIETAYRDSTKNNDITLVFDVTRANATSIGNIPKLIKLIEKFKKDEHKLKQVDIVCPKAHSIKRGIIKKCVKSSKQNKPIFLVEKL